jgi:hypothetical protein
MLSFVMYLNLNIRWTHILPIIIAVNTAILKSITKDT